MRPCTFMIFFLCKFAAGYGRQLPRRKSDKDGGYQGKLLNFGGYAKAKLQFYGSRLAVEEL